MARYIIFSFTSFVFTKHTFLWKCFRFNRILVDSRFYRKQHRIVHYIDNILFILPGRFRTAGPHPVFVFRYPYQLSRQVVPRHETRKALQTLRRGKAVQFRRAIRLRNDRGYQRSLRTVGIGMDRQFLYGLYRRMVVTAALSCFMGMETVTHGGINDRRFDGHIHPGRRSVRKNGRRGFVPKRGYFARQRLNDYALSADTFGQWNGGAFIERTCLRDRSIYSGTVAIGKIIFFSARPPDSGHGGQA